MSYTELCHHGIKGQRWGVRRFQRKDGSYTSAGRRRYDGEKASNDSKLSDKQKKALKVAAVAGTALVAAGAAYAGAKYHKILVNSLSERTTKLGKSMVSEAWMEDTRAEDLMDMADKARLRGSNDISSLFKASAQRSNERASSLRNRGFELQIKGRNKNFTNRELLKEAKDLHRDVKNTHNTYLDYYRRANNMHNLEGKPNFGKRTMRNYERFSRQAARAATKKRYSHLLKG